MSETSTAPLAHLYRRAGFGATAAELVAAEADGYSSVVARLVAGLGSPDAGADATPVPILTPPPTDYAQLRKDVAARRALATSLRADNAALTTWWLTRMLTTSNPLQEKLTFLLHGHFPTAVSKVRFPIYMHSQNQLFRTQGGGDFDSLTQALATDPAMLIWLDAASDKASHPNENFSRELMERFTMGIGTYTEADVRAAANCFTGWRLDPSTRAFSVYGPDHTSEPQTFLGTHGVTTGQQVIDIATHSPASSRFVPAAFWSHLAYPVATTDPVVDDLAPGYTQNLNIAELLSAIFQHPAFVTPKAMAGLVKQPTEYVVGTLRALGVTPAALGAMASGIRAVLAGLGQILFDPPSVGGWPQNNYWLSTSAALTRWRFAHALARRADISAVADAAPPARVDAVSELLSVPSWSSTSARALSAAASDPPSLVTLALVSPEYVSN